MTTPAPKETRRANRDRVASEAAARGERLKGIAERQAAAGTHQGGTA